MPPRWVLGYVQGSALYHPESKYRFIASNFRERHIPCDAIFFDTVHMDHNLSFTWDKIGYPNPRQLIADLRARGFRTFEIVDPGLKVDENYEAFKTGSAGDHFLRRRDGRLYSAVIWPGISAFPDFTSEKARDWWGTLMAQDVRDGVAGFLTDMNEPTVNAVTNEQGWSPKPFDPDVIFDDHGQRTPLAKNHNVYGMLMSAATRDGFLKVKPNERPFILTRATYAGGQRYAAQWTGDNMATWESLRTSLRLVMSMGVSGMPFVGSDTGGFVGYPTAELYTRWLEAGVFHPFFWTHTIDPDRPLDPWSFGIEHEAINRRIFELRYRLLPYLYNAFYQSTQTGLPIMRPLMLEFPEDAAAMDPTPRWRQSRIHVWRRSAGRAGGV
jgi:alpha-glucosidase